VLLHKWKNTWKRWMVLFDTSSFWGISTKFPDFYNRQVTHNSHLYENQDFNVLKITNLTFKTDNWNLTVFATETMLMWALLNKKKRTTVHMLPWHIPVYSLVDHLPKTGSDGILRVLCRNKKFSMSPNFVGKRRGSSLINFIPKHYINE
jgi:hypothetical protein